jgi:hypothetical protein
VAGFLDRRAMALELGRVRQAQLENPQGRGRADGSG